MINDTSLDLMYEIKSKEFFSTQDNKRLKPPVLYEVTSDKFKKIFRYKEVRLSSMLPEELSLIAKKNNMRFIMLSMNKNWIECQNMVSFGKRMGVVLLCGTFIFHKLFINLTNINCVGNYSYAMKTKSCLNRYQRNYSQIKLAEKDFVEKYYSYLLEYYDINMTGIVDSFYK